MKTKIMTGALALALTATLAGCTGDEVPVATAEQVPGPVLREAEPETPERTPDTGDYASAEAYRFEVTDTLDKSVGLSTEMEGVLQSVMSGRMSPDEGAVLFLAAEGVVATHTDFFDGNRPPAGYEEVNGHLVDALLAQERFFANGAVCLSTLDASACDAALAAGEQAVASFDAAGVAVQRLDAQEA